MPKTRIVRKEQIEGVALIYTGKKQKLGLLFETKNISPITEDRFVMEITMEALESLLSFVLNEIVSDELSTLLLEKKIKAGVFKSGGNA